jgi:hypothetical protein
LCYCTVFKIALELNIRGENEKRKSGQLTNALHFSQEEKKNEKQKIEKCLHLNGQFCSPKHIQTDRKNELTPRIFFITAHPIEVQQKIHLNNI